MEEKSIRSVVIELFQTWIQTPSGKFEKSIAIAKKLTGLYPGDWNRFARAADDLGRSRDGRRLGIYLHLVEMEKLAPVSVALGELER